MKFVTTELSKTVIRIDDKLSTWFINIGVPWDEDDTHRTLARSGGFMSNNLPVMRACNEQDEGAVYIDGVNEMTGVVYEDIKGWWKLAWPEKFGIKAIKHDRGYGKYDFWQMMMMDLSAAKSGSLKYYIFPSRDIDPTWPTVGGVDIPYEFKERHQHETKLSSFAMAQLSKRPTGGAVVVGGVLEQCTLLRAYNHILDAQSNFVNWIMTLCEDVGGGRVFRESIKLHYPHVRILGSDLGKMVRLPGEGGGKPKNKKTRIQTELAPWLENATILISDAQSPFLDKLRDAMENFSDLDDGRADERLDVLDSVYHAVKGMPEVLVGRYSEELPTPYVKPRQPHPLANMNKTRGY